MLERLPRVPFADLADGLVAGSSGSGAPSGARMLVVSAHPDDETLGGGRLVADWTRAGGAVYAATATAGEACFDVVGHEWPDLAETRVAEWRAALGVLGARPMRCLGLPDGALAAHEGRLVELLRELVDEARPDVLAGTLDVDPHPDHMAVGRALSVVARERSLPLVEWPVWLTYFSEPPAPGGLVVVGCSPEAERARDVAWECFTSQRRPAAEDLGAVVPPELVGRLTEQLAMRVLPGARTGRVAR